MTQMSFKSITFNGDTTYQIAIVVIQMFPQVRLGSKCPKTLSSVFSKLKDQISLWQQSNLIYEFPCLDFFKKYIGLTTSYMKTRIDEHSRDYNCWLKIKNNINTNNLSNHKQKLIFKTAALKHVIENWYNFNYSEVKILTMESSHNKLKILEMLHIYDNHCVNLRTDIEGVNVCKGLLSKIKHLPKGW